MVFKTNGTASSNERLRITSSGETQVTGKLSVNTTATYNTHNANFYGGNTNTGGVRIEVAHNNTAVTGNMAQSAFPHHLNLTNYSGQSSADDRMVTIGFDIPTTSTHANGVIAYQATSAGTGFFSVHNEDNNSLYEALRLDASGNLVIKKANSAFKSESSSSGDYVRMYAGSGTGKWDIYGNGQYLRISDNDSAGSVRIDTRLGVGSAASFANLASYVNATGSRTSAGLTQSNDNNYALDLWNGNNSATFVGMLMQCRTTGAAAWLAGVQHTANYLGDYFLHARNGGSSSAIVFRQKPTGQLCIGNHVTSAPSATLHIRNSGDVSGTLGGAPASIMIEATTEASWSGGEAGAELLFKKGGDITGAIRNEHDRVPGDHTYEDAGLAFYTAPAAESPTATKKFVIKSTGDVEITDGNLKFASGHGINFSETGYGGSGSSALFDDYEEGSWSPTVSQGGTGISVNSSTYTKIGRLVHIQFRGYISGTNGQSVRIGGLPFANLSNSSHQIAAVMHNGFDFSGSTEPTVTSYITSTYTFFQMYYSRTNGNGWTAVTGNETNGEQFITSLTYFTS
tara:strand:- start:448 stop:2154 length:1707 start_codon:yes stop_codon:yes gene_type:complete